MAARWSGVLQVFFRFFRSGTLLSTSTKRGQSVAAIARIGDAIEGCVLGGHLPQHSHANSATGSPVAPLSWSEAE